jgi:hypothetical protein
MANASAPYAATRQSTVSDYAAPYVGEMLGKSQALAGKGYTPYGGQRLANVDPLQQKYYEGIGNLTAYKPGQFSDQSWTDAGTMEKFMSPYQQGVTDIAKREAQRTADINATKLGANAVNQGAFGGYRHGIVEAEQDRNTAQLLNDIQTKGLQSAYESGMKQFGNETQQDLYREIYQNQANKQGYDTGIAALDKMNAAGTAMQNYEQRGLNYDYDAFTEERKFPYEQLRFQNEMLGRLPIETTNTQSNYEVNPLTAGLGAASTAYGLYDKFTNPTGSRTTPTPAPAPSASNSSYSTNDSGWIYESGRSPTRYTPGIED